LQLFLLFAATLRDALSSVYLVAAATQLDDFSVLLLPTRPSVTYTYTAAAAAAVLLLLLDG